MSELILDTEKVTEYVYERLQLVNSRLTKEEVELVLDLEFDYLVKNGFIEEEGLDDNN